MLLIPFYVPHSGSFVSCCMSFARAGALPESLERGELLRALPKRNTAPSVRQHSVSGVGAPSMSLNQPCQNQSGLRACWPALPFSLVWSFRDTVTWHAAWFVATDSLWSESPLVPPSLMSDLDGWGRFTTTLAAGYHRRVRTYISRRSSLRSIALTTSR